jgi:hypothetical protein
MSITSQNCSSIWNIREIYRQTSGACYSSGGYNIEMLLIGGGGPGSGWSQVGGGGGAGGLIYTNNLFIRSGCTYPITIGAGSNHAAQGSNNNGANSCFCYVTGGPPSGVNIIALGGGGGGDGLGLPQTYYGANQGGSGGGEGELVTNCTCASPLVPSVAINPCSCPRPAVGLQPNPVYWSAISGICGCGRNGGCGFPANAASPPNNAFNFWGGGGGGAGGVGHNGGPPSGAQPYGAAGNGGAGLTFSISGGPVGYAGGGAAGQEQLFNPTQVCGLACCGGGGTGTGVPVGNPGNFMGAAGTANRGGGGAGAQNFGPGAAGGSGVAVIRYNGVQRAAGGNSVTTCLTPIIQTSHLFTGSGCFIA